MSDEPKPDARVLPFLPKKPVRGEAPAPRPTIGSGGLRIEINITRPGDAEPDKLA